MFSGKKIPATVRKTSYSSDFSLIDVSSFSEVILPALQHQWNLLSLSLSLSPEVPLRRTWILAQQKVI